MIPTSARPLRFCLLSTFYPPWNFGGDGIQVQRLADALAGNGHSVTVVCAPRIHRLLGGERDVERPADPRVEVVALRDGLASLTAVYLTGRPMRSRRRLQRVLDGRFDVLHFHNPSLLGAPALLGMGTGLRLYTAHEQWLLCPSHVLLRRNGVVCESAPCWTCEVAHRRPPQPWRRTGLMERSLRRVDALVLPSRASLRLHERFAALTRLEVIEHFVPEPPPEDAGTEERGRPYFLFVGRLEPIKGAASLLRAFRHRAEDLVVAGDGGERPRLERAAAGLRNVHFAGQLPQERLAQLYRGALAVVVPTVGHEAGPVVPLEAFALGTPAIVRRFGSLEDLAADTGAALAYGTEAELHEALDRVAADEEFRSELGRRARAAVAERHTRDAHLDRYLALIADLARTRGDSEVAAAAEAARPRSPAAGGTASVR